MVRVHCFQRTGVAIEPIRGDPPPRHMVRRWIPHTFSVITLVNAIGDDDHLIQPRRSERRSDLLTDPMLVSPVRDGRAYSEDKIHRLWMALPKHQPATIIQLSFRMPVAILDGLARADGIPSSHIARNIQNELSTLILQQSAVNCRRHFEATPVQQPTRLAGLPITHGMHFDIQFTPSLRRLSIGSSCPLCLTAHLGGTGNLLNDRPERIRDTDHLHRLAFENPLH